VNEEDPVRDRRRRKVRSSCKTIAVNEEDPVRDRATMVEKGGGGGGGRGGGSRWMGEAQSLWGYKCG